MPDLKLTTQFSRAYVEGSNEDTHLLRDSGKRGKGLVGTDRPLADSAIWFLAKFLPALNPFPLSTESMFPRALKISYRFFLAKYTREGH
jgi:hypothetical protein